MHFSCNQAMINKVTALPLMISLLASPAVQATDTEALDKWLKETTASHRVAGLTAVIVRDGKTVFKKSYGRVDAASDVPLTTHHYFHMASVSKPIVAVAVMQLVEAGKVDLNAPVTRYLPYFTMADDRLSGVTVARLLSHTSGMPDVDDYEWQSPQNDEQALERWVKAQAGKSLLFNPGEKQAYSNIGFEILGDLVAKVSGMSFEDYIKTNIFKPLGMKGSSFIYYDIPTDLRVKGHAGVTRAFPLDYYPYNRRHAPSSTYHTNGDEFVLWLNAFANPDRLVKTGVLKLDTLERMWTPQFVVSETKENTLGWSRNSTDEGVLLRHGGSDDGFRSEMAVFEDIDAGYGLMTNMESAPMAEIRLALRRATVKQPLPPVPGPSLAMKAHQLYSEKGTQAVIDLFAEHKAKDDGEMMYAIYQFSKDLFLSNNISDAEKMAEGMITYYAEHPALQTFLDEVKREAGKKGP